MARGLSIAPAEVQKLTIRQQYDKDATITNLFAWSGTASQLVFTKPLPWLLIVFHIMLWALWEFHDCTGALEHVKGCVKARVFFKKYPIQISELAMLTSLVTFFVVFYNGNCFTRYTTLYDKANTITGRIHNVSLWLRSYFEKPATRWNVIRYILASHYVHYWTTKKRNFDWQGGSLKNEEDAKNDPRNPGTFDTLAKLLIEKGVLIPAEAECLGQYKGNKHKLLYSWAIISLKKVMQLPQPDGEKGNPMLNSEFEQTALLSNLKEEIVEIRGAIGAIDNIMLFPMPFHYYHIVNLTLILQLVLLAYAFLFINGGNSADEDTGGSPFSLIAYPAVVFVLMGLKEVANGMADPFGDADYDFNLNGIQEGIYNECKLLCEEKPEPFLAHLGDPKFNPRRNPDGTLIEADDQPAEEPQEPPEIMWKDHDYQQLKSEKEDLEAELKRGGIPQLTEQVQRLVDVSLQSLERIAQLEHVPRQLVKSNDLAMQRVNKLEQLLTSQLMLLASSVESRAAAPAGQVWAGAGGAPGGMETAVGAGGGMRGAAPMMGGDPMAMGGGPAASTASPNPLLPPFGLTFKANGDIASGVWIIDKVDAESAAEKGKLRPGDRVLSVDGMGTKFMDMDLLNEAIDRKKASDMIVFDVRRADGTRENLWVHRHPAYAPKQ